ncbi:hypothetical protein [Desulforamulus aeronauticus]|uniref:Zinc-ribbon domain-containing protein n=1 Tax=Desulforamulus aeronauticus DSM 10349 TaxID=1121421 RepID=A0A1M6U5V9_9FIRM|nr:hypothetical protein [Desulforamulus aeronauticus]SHK64478.1 hypothetical protein SAMN02745123_02579 [Desulforamulus aeronauticus DSM 10349]
MHILWLIMGLLGAIWVFWDTRKQGYTRESSVRWAIGTFLVPAAVIPFYLMQSTLRNKFRRSHPTGPRDVTSNISLKCPWCGEFYQGNPEHCPHCKKELKQD